MLISQLSAICVNQSVECYLRCFISANPGQWSKWLPLCEYWHNTSWHASLGKTPFEVVYGQQPRSFGLTPSDAVASPDLQQWFHNRTVLLASVRQHLVRAQQRMKHQADKHRQERQFRVGARVYLKLQPYVQSSVAPQANHKLLFKFYGPYTVTARIGSVAYRLAFPPGSRIHPVFHVSQLKAALRPSVQVTPELPSPEALVQYPVRILRRSVRSRGSSSVPQVLVQWSNASDNSATWEDLLDLHHRLLM